MIPLPVNRAINMFSGKITAYDTDGGWINRRWQDSAPTPDYAFSGSIQPATSKDTKALEEGYVAAGVVVVHTTGKVLYFKDLDTSKEHTKQTYIRHQGSVYRVFGEKNRVVNGAHRRYLAVKEVKRG